MRAKGQLRGPVTIPKAPCQYVQRSRASAQTVPKWVPELTVAFFELLTPHMIGGMIEPTLAFLPGTFSSSDNG